MIIERENTTNERRKKMRVRYEIAGRGGYEAKCDLTERKARKLFDELKTDGLCEWAELVGEDDDNYMEIIEQYDNIKSARMLKGMFGDLVRSKH